MQRRASSRARPHRGRRAVSSSGPQARSAYLHRRRRAVRSSAPQARSACRPESSPAGGRAHPAPSRHPSADESMKRALLRAQSQRTRGVRPSNSPRQVPDAPTRRSYDFAPVGSETVTHAEAKQLICALDRHLRTCGQDLDGTGATRIGRPSPVGSQLGPQTQHERAHQRRARSSALINRSPG